MKNFRVSIFSTMFLFVFLNSSNAVSEERSRKKQTVEDKSLNDVLEGEKTPEVKGTTNDQAVSPVIAILPSVENMANYVQKNLETVVEEMAPAVEKMANYAQKNLETAAEEIAPAVEKMLKNAQKNLETAVEEIAPAVEKIANSTQEKGEPLAKEYLEPAANLDSANTSNETPLVEEKLTLEDDMNNIQGLWSGKCLQTNDGMKSVESRYNFAANELALTHFYYGTKNCTGELISSENSYKTFVILSNEKEESDISQLRIVIKVDAEIEEVKTIDYEDLWKGEFLLDHISLDEMSLKSTSNPATTLRLIRS